jgi:dihydroorotase-like cyclic amidohydrolase
LLGTWGCRSQGREQEEVPNPFRNEQHSPSQAETQTPEHDVAVITAADEPLHHLHISSVEATKELISCLQEDGSHFYFYLFI